MSESNCIFKQIQAMKMNRCDMTHETQIKWVTHTHLSYVAC